MQLVLRNVAHPEHPRIGQVEGEQHLVAGLGVALQRQVDFEIGLGQLLGVDVDLDVDLRRVLLRRERARRVRVLEGQVLGVLRKRVELRRILGLRAVRRRVVGHGRLLGWGVSPAGTRIARPWRRRTR
jgi:hypothetical protein